MTRDIKDSEISPSRSFELQAGEYFEKKGYKADVTRSTGDWGVDVFVEKDGKKYAVQVKNYGGCQTKISRKDVMELYGAAAFFDCDGAKFVYNGEMSKSAREVACKLGIQCIALDFKRSSRSSSDFENCWETYVKPLVGSRIKSTSGSASYSIDEVTDSLIRFTNANGNKYTIRKDILRWTYEKSLNRGEVRGKEIRDEFKTRFSSVVVAVFLHIPLFKVLSGPRIVPANI